MKKNYGLYINGEFACAFPFEQTPTLDQFCLRAGVAMIPTGSYIIFEIIGPSIGGAPIEESNATIEV